MAPAFARTPESLFSGLRRKDSKNPLTTCYGTTAAGRPCRRSLAAAVNALNAADTYSGQSSVVAVLEDNNHGSEITAFFCWQHKDQADAYHADRARKVQLRTRGSLEDMMSSMGLQDAKHVRTALKAHRQHETVKRMQTTEKRVDNIYESVETGPRAASLTIGDGRADDHEDAPLAKRRQGVYKKPPRHRSLWQALCGCYTEPSRDVYEQRPPRPGPRPQRAGEKAADLPVDSARRGTHHRPIDRPNIPTAAKAAHSRSAPVLHVAGQRPAMREVHSQPVVTRKPPSKRPTEPKSPRDDQLPAVPSSNRSPMNDALNMIPQNASITLASALMAEMGKVGQDSREGYIYMYWLDEAQQTHADDDGESLLSGDNNTSVPAPASKLLLKIGRAENVHRRLSQWQLQCGYKPLLVRSYPQAGTRQKVCHLHRVERLIHTELSEWNVKRQCQPCAKEHREWFEVDGRDGVREVDRIIEKWIAWSARQPDIS